MVKRSLLAILFSILFIGAWGLNVDRLQEEKPFHNAIEGMVRIIYTVKDQNIYGEPIITEVKASGVVIARDRVVTCYHVFDSAGIGNFLIIRVNMDGTVETRENVKIIQFNKKLDLCLVLVQPEFDITPIKLATDVPFLGDDIFFAGYSSLPIPALRFYKYSTFNLGIFIFPIYFGDSGGGVFNMKGELIGIITSGLTIYRPVQYSTLLGAAIDLDRLKSFLNDGKAEGETH